MTKSELLEMARKLQEQAEAMPDDTGENPASTETNSGEEGGDKVDEKKKENTKPEGDETGEGAKEEDMKKETNDNGEVEEQEQIEPQTNGKITDDVTPKVDAQFENPTNAEETNGVEQVLAANFDQRFATFTTELTRLKTEMDKMKVALSEILTRIELVQEVTDKVTTVDHDSLLTESVKLLI